MDHSPTSRVSALQRLIFVSFATLISLSSLPPSQAQTPPAKTFQPGFWQPVARFNPDQAVSLTLVNQVSVPLNFDLVTEETPAPRQIPPGESVSLTNLPNSNYVMIYPATPSESAERPLTLKFTPEVEEKTNAVTVTISEAEPSFLGHRTVNLQKTGAVFFY
ncbi:MAG: hypothetical protein ACK5CA_04925 [Cyanobacteriota bacterium]